MARQRPSLVARGHGGATWPQVLSSLVESEGTRAQLLLGSWRNKELASPGGPCGWGAAGGVGPEGGFVPLPPPAEASTVPAPARGGRTRGRARSPAGPLAAAPTSSVRCGCFPASATRRRVGSVGFGARRLPAGGGPHGSLESLVGPAWKDDPRYRDSSGPSPRGGSVPPRRGDMERTG